MAYRWKRNESVRKAVRRLLRRRIRHALACIEDGDKGAAIHCARKDIKKARAVLRLVRPRIAGKDFRRLKAALRKAAAPLATVRDAVVKVQTARALARYCKGQLASGAMRQLRYDARVDADAEIKRFKRKKISGVAACALRRAGRVAAHLKVEGRGWKALHTGLESTYRDGKRACARAQAEPSPENFHAWRKRVKDLWYQARLLLRACPEQMDAIASELEALVDYLGDDHDLFVLRQYAEARLSYRAKEQEVIGGLVVQRQRELRDLALVLGARFYAEQPSAFCSRVSGYWHTWHRPQEPHPTASSTT